MIHDIIHLLAHNIYPAPAQIPQRLNVLFGCNHNQYSLNNILRNKAKAATLAPQRRGQSEIIILLSQSSGLPMKASPALKKFKHPGFRYIPADGR
jgi:hypothetical protein